MSTIKADTIVASDGTSPVTLTKQSAAKAWVYFDNLSTNVTRGSFSISSNTDNGTGDATVTLSNAMTDAFSCIAGLTGYGTNNPSTRFQSGCIPSSTTVRLQQITHGGSVADQDCNHMCIIGDLA